MKPWVIRSLASSILPLSPPAIIQLIPPRRKKRIKANPPIITIVCHKVATVIANWAGELVGSLPPGTAVLVMAAR